MKRAISFLTVMAFTVSTLAAEAIPLLTLPAPDKLLPLSETYSFPLMKGVRFNPADPLNLEFVFDTAHQQTISKEEVKKLVEYFLAGLTIPEEDLWVNLSPYEDNRIAPESLASTDMGVDLLGQDYVLKQLSSSLTYPESETGREYWNLKSEISDQEFNKIWIVPDRAQMYEEGTAGYVVSATLKAMTERDYVAQRIENGESITDQTASDAVISVLLPRINAELNSGKNFATLRQIHHSLLLAMWFKAKFRETFFGSYFNAAKTAGIDTEDPAAREKIFNLYCEAFSKGVFNYDRKERDVTGRLIKRHYFSGGWSNALMKSTTGISNSSLLESATVNSFTGKSCSAVVSLAGGNAVAKFVATSSTINGTDKNIPAATARAVVARLERELNMSANDDALMWYLERYLRRSFPLGRTIDDISGAIDEMRQLQPSLITSYPSADAARALVVLALAYTVDPSLSISFEHVFNGGVRKISECFSAALRGDITRAEIVDGQHAITLEPVEAYPHGFLITVKKNAHVAGKIRFSFGTSQTSSAVDVLTVLEPVLESIDTFKVFAFDVGGTIDENTHLLLAALANHGKPVAIISLQSADELRQREEDIKSIALGDKKHLLKVYGDRLIGGKPQKETAIPEICAEFGVNPWEILYFADQFAGARTADLAVAEAGVTVVNVGVEPLKGFSRAYNIGGNVAGTNRALGYIIPELVPATGDALVTEHMSRALASLIWEDDAYFRDADGHRIDTKEELISAFTALWLQGRPFSKMVDHQMGSDTHHAIDTYELTDVPGVFKVTQTASWSPAINGSTEAGGPWVSYATVKDGKLLSARSVEELLARVAASSLSAPKSEAFAASYKLWFDFLYKEHGGVNMMLPDIAARMLAYVDEYGPDAAMRIKADCGSNNESIPESPAITDGALIARFIETALLGEGRNLVEGIELDDFAGIIQPDRYASPDAVEQVRELLERHLSQTSSALEVDPGLVEGFGREKAVELTGKIKRSSVIVDGRRAGIVVGEDAENFYLLTLRPYQHVMKEGDTIPVTVPDVLGTSLELSATVADASKDGVFAMLRLSKLRCPLEPVQLNRNFNSNPSVQEYFRIAAGSRKPSQDKGEVDTVTAHPGQALLRDNNLEFDLDGIGYPQRRAMIGMPLLDQYGLLIGVVYGEAHSFDNQGDDVLFTKTVNDIIKYLEKTGIKALSAEASSGIAQVQAKQPVDDIGGVAFTGVAASAITSFTGRVELPEGFDRSLFNGFSVISVSDIVEKPAAELVRG